MPTTIINGKVYEMNCTECMKSRLVTIARIRCFESLKMYVEAGEERDRLLTLADNSNS